MHLKFASNKPKPKILNNDFHQKLIHLTDLSSDNLQRPSKQAENKLGNLRTQITKNNK